jgi:hypothetical protein
MGDAQHQSGAEEENEEGISAVEVMTNMLDPRPEDRIRDGGSAHDGAEACR